MKNIAYVLSPKMATKVEKIKTELGLKEPSEVLTKAIELLDLSMGRRVILKEKESRASWRIDDLEDFKQTVKVD